MLSDILEECAKVRGLPPQMSYRTLHDFDWFVTEMIFGNTTQKIDNIEVYKKIRVDSYEGGYPYLISFALAFLRYCIAEYGEDPLETPSD